MYRQLLRCKIHRATVTASSLDYEGSLTIDEDLMERAGIIPYEAVMVSNLNNGERFSTYALPGTRGKGEIILNGPTARLGVIGDKVIIFCYELFNDEEAKRHVPQIIQVDHQNRAKEANPV
ncbi:MAG: aspartate 1-decarboxylase [Nitrospira sp.]|nr:aspartate 1-decarboxylase [Nitrospira sp.]HBP89670.1 aspartate 1-decarboxylase [Nitrospiraceae bacterium]HNP29549.1 aspartate 1-decarboxylase [Nitrospirales bacterium]